MNQLDQLKQFTTVVADSGDFRSLLQYRPHDATTNPSLILKAVQTDDYAAMVEEVVAAHPGEPGEAVIDALLVRFGTEILKVVPGRVSTEVDARFSFDVRKSFDKGLHLIELYEREGIGRERVLIKLASTWEGIQAARALQERGIRCNMTLLFSFCQAVACGEIGAQLISPFVGRIYDWYKKSAGSDWDEAANAGADDPGVKSVGDIYGYFKHQGIATEVMGASFRNVGQIRALAGCDLMTISPELLAQLQGSDEPLQRVLDPKALTSAPGERLSYSEAAFRFSLNQDAMATEKLAEGIRNFAADADKLDKLIAALRT